MAVAATGRPEDAMYVTNTSHKPLSSRTYTATHLLVGLASEAATRHFGLLDTLSLTRAANKFADATGLRDFLVIPGANAQEVGGSAAASTAPAEEAAAASAKEAASATTEAAATTWGSYVPDFITTGMDQLKEQVWAPISTAIAPATEYVSDNSDWMIDAGGVALVAAVINMIAQKRGVKSASLRNFASLLSGTVAVWGTKAALSYAGVAEPIAFAKTADMAVRIFAAHFVLKHATPLAQKALEVTSKTIAPFGAPFCYEGPQKGKKF
ncbi:MAG: hypothetical protein P0S96_01095 [Simkaniaceae bacterium]|nr:hypothetical protein [Candidatus Sacchlamyda saccharinae]